MSGMPSHDWRERGCNGESYFKGIERGLKEAEQIAEWLIGQDREAAKRQIEKVRQRLCG